MLGRLVAERSIRDRVVASRESGFLREVVSLRKSGGRCAMQRSS